MPKIHQVSDNKKHIDLQAPADHSKLITRAQNHTQNNKKLDQIGYKLDQTGSDWIAPQHTKKPQPRNLIPDPDTRPRYRIRPRHPNLNFEPLTPPIASWFSTSSPKPQAPSRFTLPPLFYCSPPQAPSLKPQAASRLPNLKNLHPYKQYLGPHRPASPQYTYRTNTK